MTNAQTAEFKNRTEIAGRVASDGTSQTFGHDIIKGGTPRRARRCYVVRLGITSDGIAKGGACLFDAKRHGSLEDAYWAAYDCWMHHAND